MNTENESNKPAFPVVANNMVYATGITARDYFAAKAMMAVMGETQEMVPDGFINWIKQLLHAYGFTFLKVKYKHIEGVYSDAAERSYRYADAMLEARQ